MEGRRASDVPESVFAAFNEQRAEFFLCFGSRFRFERHPLDVFPAVLGFDGNAREETLVSTPQPANRMLAVIEYAGVFVAT